MIKILVKDIGTMGLSTIKISLSAVSGDPQQACVLATKPTGCV